MFLGQIMSQENLDSFPYNAFLFQSNILFLFFYFLKAKRKVRAYRFLASR